MSHKWNSASEILRSGIRFRPGLEALEDRMVLDATPVMLLDVNPNPQSTVPMHIVDLNGVAVFQRSIQDTLYRSDGTPEGTYDLQKEAKAFYRATNVAAAAGLVYFAGDSTGGIELWVTDGTTNVLRRVADINPGGNSSTPGGFTAVGSTVYFAATAAGGRELYRTDGTTEGTFRVADVRLGHQSSNPEDLNAVGSDLYFTAENVTGQRNLMLLSGGNVTALTAGVTITEACAVGTNVYFVTSDNRLWKTDGSVEGTEVIRDDFTAPLTNLTSSGNHLYFTGTQGAATTLFQSDGTFAGTISLGGVDPAELVDFGGTLYFTSNSASTGRELYRVDGAGTGIELVADILPGTSSSDIRSLTVVGQILYFSANDGVHGAELWKTDGTTTTLVRDISVGSAGSAPSELAAVGDRLFFSANDPAYGRELWVSDGTEEGTSLAADLSGTVNSMSVGAIYTLNGMGVFLANDGTNGQSDLYRTNGVPGDVEKIYDFPTSLSDTEFAEYNGALYFRGPSLRLWKTDGTSSGTQLVSDSLELASDRMIVFDGLLYVLGSDGLDWAIWVSDGTASGTQEFFDPPTPEENWSDINRLDVAGDRLYFTTLDYENFREVLWISDGTVSGTKSLGSYWSVGGVTDVNGVLVYVVSVAEEVEGVTTVHTEFWRTNGTPSGTYRLIANVDGGISNFIEFNGELYFQRSTASFPGTYELWKTDGTVAGTGFVAPLASALSKPVVLGDYLYFVTFENQTNKLYRSDGTAAGTTLVLQTYRIQDVITTEDALVIAAEDITYGRELWISNGTPDGSLRLTDIGPGWKDFSILQMVATGNQVYLRADDGVHGAEPWGVRLGSPVAFAGGSYEIDEGQSLILDASSSQDTNGNGLSYSWDVNGDGIFGDATGVTPTLTWEQLGALGITDGTTVFSISVRVTDGFNWTHTSAPTTLTVHNAPPVVEINGPNLLVRGQTAAFVFIATDSSPTDQAAGFFYAIDWENDGTVDTTTNAPLVNLTHVFAESGDYTIRVTAADKDGATSAPQLLHVHVADWALLPDANDPGKTNLHWGGTQGIDGYAFLPGLVLKLAEANQIFAGLGANGQITGQPQLTFIPSFNGKLIVYGQGGNDLIFADVLNAPLEFYGGDGDDVLVGGRNSDLLDGGRGNDILIGGTLETDGDDTIWGGAGDDLIIGSSGADKLYGGVGRDLILAGSIQFGVNVANAVFSIQAEWTSGHSYAAKIANLTGVGDSSRFNGNYFLTPDATILNDADVDQIFGEDDQDWLLADVAQDIVPDVSIDEMVLPLNG